MKKFFISFIALIVIAISGCFGDKQEVSFDTLETNRNNAKSNAEYNAQKFRAESPVYSNSSLEVQDDSTQMNSSGLYELIKSRCTKDPVIICLG